MATVTQAILTCDVCGNANNVQTWAFGFDGERYEIDLCPEDGNGLSKVAAGYTSKARKVATGRSQRRNGHRPRPPRAARGSGAKAKPAGSRQEARAGRSQRRTAKAASKQTAKAASKQAAKASGMNREKGVHVYGILPADVEMAAEIPGVGEHPGPLEVVRSDGLAALISEVSLGGRLGSPEDLRTYREILDSTAIEVPVVPLRFGTVLSGGASVADELLAPRHDEFAAALERLEGRAEFIVKGRYVQRAGTAKREEDARALRQALESVCVASVVREPVDELDAVHVAFLVAVDDEGEVERAIEDLAREWDGRIEVQLLGPMAAYDFVS